MPDALLDEILEEIELDEPECARCGRAMVTERHWQRAGQEERWELWLDGYESYGRGPGPKLGYCNPCSFKSGPLEDGELTLRDARRFRVLTYKELRDQGLTMGEIAPRLGITYDGLRRNVKNWKERGWL